ncbi:kinase-like domain, phloem protein 2-like protein [Tanacetum coccineum]
MIASSSDSTKVTLKLLIDTKSKEVLFAEANKEFVDFLFNILSLPVSTVIKLLRKNSNFEVNQEDIEEIIDVQKQFPTNNNNGYENDDEGGKLNEVDERKHFKLSTMYVLYDSSKVKPFHLKPSAESSCFIIKSSHTHILFMYVKEV